MTKKHKHGPRPASTYRGARRNATRATGGVMERRGPEARLVSLCPTRIRLNAKRDTYA